MTFSLNSEQYEELRLLQKRAGLSRRRYRKVTVLIMLHKGYTVSTIENILAIDDTMIYRYIRNYYFASCAAHEVNPREWLKDVLIRIGHHKPSKYEELLPANWKKLMAPAEVTNTDTPDLAGV